MIDQPILFTVEGVVQEGAKKGTTLGYPTANVPCDPSIPSGIYAGEALWEGATYPAALYKETDKDILEAHLLDFSANLYHEKLILRARIKVRDATRFLEREDLVAAITQDVADIKRLCSRG